MGKAPPSPERQSRRSSSPSAQTADPGRQKLHLVVAGASQWGQYACAHVLHRVIGQGGRVTLIVARRHEDLFESKKPAIGEWQQYDSVKKCIESLQDADKPIDYVFDDHLQHLAAELLRQKGAYRRLGYVVTDAVEHYPYARILATCCDRVLVEKPLSKLVVDVRPGGRFERLDADAAPDVEVFSCEHYAFRKGFSDAKSYLDAFVRRHWGHEDLRYEFRFFETDEKQRLASRLPAMQDGSSLDVAVTHGLGPLLYILRKAAGIGALGHHGDLSERITWTDVVAMQARDGSTVHSELTVPVLAETAIRLEGEYRSDAGAEKVDLLLESCKWGRPRERHFRVICGQCSDRMEGVDRAARSKVYFGVSLGAAGFSDCDPTLEANPAAADGRYQPPHRDGGWKSDLVEGSSGEAENAQAAMIEAFLATELDDRFLPLKEASQIVRLAIEAQALAFFSRQRSWYRLSDGFDPESLEREADRQRPARGWRSDPDEDWEGAHQTLKNLLWPDDAKEDPETLEGLTSALGLDRADGPSCRLVTVLGQEGLGNTDVASWLEKELNDHCEAKKVNVEIILHHVRRDEHWCSREGSKGSTFDRLIRDLGSSIGVSSAAIGNLSEDLLKRIIGCREELETENRVLILNGVDRFDAEPWAKLMRLLNELPRSHRIVFISNRVDQACGWVLRTGALLRSVRRAPEDRPHLEALRARLPRRVPDRESRWRRLRGRIGRMAGGNATVERQLCAWLLHVVLASRSSQQEDYDPWREMELALARIGVPRSITPHPERLLDRLSLACLAAVAPAERQAISVMARLSDGFPRQTARSAYPWLLDKLDRAEPPEPLCSVFLRTRREEMKPYDNGELVFFPRVRRTAERILEDEGKAEMRDLQREVEDRRVLLALPSEPDFDEIRLDRVLALGGRGKHGLGKLDLDGTEFEDQCRRLADSFEVGLRGRIDNRSARLMKLLLEEPTNLGLRVRARLMSLHAWAELGKSTEPVEILQVMNELAAACDVLERAEPFRKTLRWPQDEDLAGEGQEPDEPQQRRIDRELEVQTQRDLLLAEVFLTFFWHWLMGLKKARTYVFGRSGLIRRSEKSLREFLRGYPHDSEDSSRQRRQRRVRAQAITTLAFFYARASLGKQPPLEDSYGYQSALKADRRLFKVLGEDGRRLLLSAHLIEAAQEINRKVSEDSDGRRARAAARAEALNLLTGALFYCELMVLSSGNKARRRFADRARKSFGAVRPPHSENEPYAHLVRARLMRAEILERNGEQELDLARQARTGYQRRGQDYFANLAGDFRKELKSRS